MFEGDDTQGRITPLKSDVDVLRLAERILVEGRDGLTIYMEHATSEPILMAIDFVDVLHVGVEEADNVDKEGSKIGTDDEREGVGVGEGDNVKIEDYRNGDNNVKRKDVGVASKDEIESGNVVGRGNGEDVNDFTKTDEDIPKLYLKDDFVDPDVSRVNTRKASMERHECLWCNLLGLDNVEI
ncbi:hypothetical protein CJ030_MR5G018724 [Morella rubra]|uniref:Uncharacterized protein n=1 Tax=Morella rubra TaxID=262757 RepID=A0A6A1VJZ2_9ROSI|nr:hypothetical protein CJ030_MR5G018724 [Morella rubra]